MISEKNVTIINQTGLHARPASQFVQKAGKFKAEIEIVFEEREVNAKSIMGVMSLGIGKDNEIKLRAEGEDADQAVEALVKFIEEEMPKEDE